MNLQGITFYKLLIIQILDLTSFEKSGIPTAHFLQQGDSSTLQYRSIQYRYYKHWAKGKINNNIVAQVTGPRGMCCCRLSYHLCRATTWMRVFPIWILTDEYTPESIIWIRRVFPTWILTHCLLDDPCPAHAHPRKNQYWLKSFSGWTAGTSQHSLGKKMKPYRLRDEKLLCKCQNIRGPSVIKTIMGHQIVWET